MPTSIIPQEEYVNQGLMEHYAAVLADFKCRMPLRKAEEAYNLENGELRAAIDNGLIRYYPAGKTQYRVGPMQVAEYIEKHRTLQKEPLAG